MIEDRSVIPNDRVAGSKQASVTTANYRSSRTIFVRSVARSLARSHACLLGLIVYASVKSNAPLYPRITNRDSFLHLPRFPKTLSLGRIHLTIAILAVSSPPFQSFFPGLLQISPSINGNRFRVVHALLLLLL